MIDNEHDQMRHDIYLLISTLCRQSPDRALLQFLSQLEAESGIQALTLAWSQLALSAQQTTVSQVEDEYQDLFIGVGKGEIVPFGSWHIAGSLMDKPLASVRHDLNCFGFQRKQHVKEPEDHISALCDVIAMLLDKGDEQQAGQFFNRHIAPWYRHFCQQIASAPSARFYLSVGALIQAFFDVEQVGYAPIPVHSGAGVKIEIKNITVESKP